MASYQPTFSACRLLEVVDFGQRRILATRAQEIAQRRIVDLALAASVEQLEGFFVIRAGLRLFSNHSTPRGETNHDSDRS